MLQGRCRHGVCTPRVSKVDGIAAPIVEKLDADPRLQENTVDLVADLTSLIRLPLPRVCARARTVAAAPGCFFGSRSLSSREFSKLLAPTSSLWFYTRAILQEGH